GICWRNTSYWRVRPSPDDVSFCCVLCRRPIGPASGRGDHCSHLYAHFSKRGNDDRDAANHGCAATLDQLQWFFRVNDHVWSGTREQRLDSSKSFRVMANSCRGSWQLPVLQTTDV